MIVDFQHHFTPRELIKEDPGDRLILNYDASGAPSYTIHSLLYDLDEHVRMMDVAGIDAAWLTSAAGMCADLDTSRLVNDKAKQAERDYPGRFIGAAHAHPLGGAAAFKELARCRHELGFQGVTITSEFDGKWIDDPAIEPFWDEVGKLGLFVFVHPALKLNRAEQFDAYDTARGVGREFSLIMATIRLVNSGVFDRHPELTVHMAHLSGGIASHAGADPQFPGQGVLGHRRQPAPRHRRRSTTSTITSATISCSTPPDSPAASARSKPDCAKSPRPASSSPPTIRRKSASARSCATSCATSARSGPMASGFCPGMSGCCSRSRVALTHRRRAPGAGTGATARSCH